MSGGGTQKCIRKALGALKDATTVLLAKLNSDNKELEIAFVKATNHVERPAKEKYIRAIFSAVSATRPLPDVWYCILCIARRLAKTHNWAVALKTLIVIHRALREADPTFHKELMNYGRSRTNFGNHMLNLSHFKDDSSPNAWDYSAWIRTYALFLAERLECCCVLKYDVEMDHPRTKDLDTAELLEHLLALQQLLFCVLGCQPQGAAVHNSVVHLALSMVASESIKIYQAISDGTVYLVDKFFKMQRHDALKALDIYRRAGQQAERLSEFYEVCKRLDIGRGEKFIKIEQSHASLLQAMEEYVRDAHRMSMVCKDQVADNKISAAKEVLAIEYKKTEEAEVRSDSPPPPEPIKVAAPVVVEPLDLLGLNDPAPDTSALDEKNVMAVAIVPVSDQMEQTREDMPASSSQPTREDSEPAMLAGYPGPSSRDFFGNSGWRPNLSAEGAVEFGDLGSTLNFGERKYSDSEGKSGCDDIGSSKVGYEDEGSGANFVFHSGWLYSRPTLKSEQKCAVCSANPCLDHWRFIIPKKQDHTRKGKRDNPASQSRSSCLECGKSFPSFKGLVEHVKNKHPNRVDRLMERLKLATQKKKKFWDISPKRIECTWCPASFDTGKLYRDHVLENHGTWKYDKPTEPDTQSDDQEINSMFPGTKLEEPERGTSSLPKNSTSPEVPLSKLIYDRHLHNWEKLMRKGYFSPKNNYETRPYRDFWIPFDFILDKVDPVARRNIKSSSQPHREDKPSSSSSSQPRRTDKPA